MNVRSSQNTYHHGDLRAAMLEAVAALVRERGVGQVSLRAAARKIGVTHAAATYHFGNKAGLLTEFATRGYLQLAECVRSEIDKTCPPDGPALLAAAGRGYVRFAVENPERFEVMFRLDLVNPDDEAYVAASDAAYELLSAAIRRCEREGFLGNRDPETVAVAAWSLTHGLAALWIGGRLTQRLRDANPEMLADMVTELFVDSVLRSEEDHGTNQ